MHIYIYSHIHTYLENLGKKPWGRHAINSLGADFLSLLMYTGVFFFVNATGEFIKCDFYGGKRVHIHCGGVQCYSLKTDRPNYTRWTTEQTLPLKTQENKHYSILLTAIHKKPLFTNESCIPFGLMTCRCSTSQTWQVWGRIAHILYSQYSQKSGLRRVNQHSWQLLFLSRLKSQKAQPSHAPLCILQSGFI